MASTPRTLANQVGNAAFVIHTRTFISSTRTCTVTCDESTGSFRTTLRSA